MNRRQFFIGLVLGVGTVSLGKLPTPISSNRMRAISQVKAMQRAGAQYSRKTFWTTVDIVERMMNKGIWDKLDTLFVYAIDENAAVINWIKP